MSARRLVIMLLICLGGAGAKAACPTASATVLRRDSFGLTLQWTFQDFTPWERSAGAGESRRRAYAARVKAAVGSTSTSMLIRRHLWVGQQIAATLAPGDRFAETIARDTRNSNRVLNGKIGHLMALSCWESLAFETFLTWTGRETADLEFGAQVWRQGGVRTLLVDFDRRNHGATTTSAVMERATRNLRSRGWIYQAHLHNHPFNFDNLQGDFGGVPVPSEPDVKLYRARRPEVGLVTNGIETLHLSKRDWRAFELE